MKAKLTKPWEEDALSWPQERKNSIKFARVTLSDPNDPDSRVTGLWAVHPRGTVFEGAKAEMLIRLGVAVQVAEVQVIANQRRLEE